MSPEVREWERETLVQEFLYRLSPVRDDTSLYRAHEGLSRPLSIVFTLRAVFTIHRDSSFTTGRSGSAPPSFLSEPAPHFPGNKTDGKICVCYRLGTESDTGHTLPVLCLHRVLHVTVLHYGHCIMYSSCNICHNLYDSRLNQF